MCNPRQELSNAFNTITGWVDRGLTGIGKTFDAIAKDPLPTIATVALTAVGVPPYVTSLARTAMSGGNMDNYVIGLVTSYAGSQIGAAAGDLAFPELGDVAGYGGFGDVAFQPTATDAILKTVISNASAQGATALLQGKELDQVFNSALTGAVGGLINTTLRTELGLDPSKIEGKLISDATKAAVGSILNNQDPALAIGNALSQSAFGTLANTAASGLKSVVSDLNKTATEFETTQSEATTLRGEIDAESTRLSGIASILNSESTALNTKQQTLKNSYDLVNLSGQIYDWRSNTIHYNPAANTAYAQRMGLAEFNDPEYGTYYVNPATNETVFSLGLHAKDTLEKQADYLNTNIPQFESAVTNFNTKLATFNTDKTKLDDKVDTYDGYVTKLFGEDGNGGLNKTIQDLLVDRDKYLGDLDKSITGLSEVAGEEISDVAKEIATEAVNTLDQNFRTSDEVADAFANNPLFADYEASPADIAKFVGEGADADLQGLINSFVDERTLDAAELADIAKKEGLTLTQDDLLALVQQGDEKELTKQFTERFDSQAVTREEAKEFFGDYQPSERELGMFTGARNEESVKSQIADYADKRSVDYAEARQALISAGYDDPPDEVVKQFVGQSQDRVETTPGRRSGLFRRAAPTQTVIPSDENFESSALGRIQSTYDPQFVTREEAQEFFDDIGFKASDEQLLKFIGKRDESSAFKDIEEFVTGQRELDAQKAGFPDYATQQRFDSDIDAYKAIQPRADVMPIGAPKVPLTPLTPGLGAEEFFGTRPSTEPSPYALEENAKEFVTPPVVEPPGSATPPVLDEGNVDEYDYSDTLRELLEEMDFATPQDLEDIQRGFADIGSTYTNQLNTAVKDIAAKVNEYESYGATRDEAMSAAIDDMAETLGQTRQEFLERLGETQSSLNDRIKSSEKLFAEQMGGLQTDLIDRIGAFERAGLSRDDAIQRSISELSDEMGETEESLLQKLGTSTGQLREEMGSLETRLGQQIGGVQSDIADLKKSYDTKLASAVKDITDQVNEYEAYGATRDEALQAAIDNVSNSLGIAQDELLSQLGETQKSLNARIVESEKAFATRLSGMQTNLIDRIGAFERAGLSRDDAIKQSITELADELGDTEAGLLEKLGTTESTLKGQIEAGLEEVTTKFGEQVGTLKSDLLSRIKTLEDAGFTRDEAISSAVADLSDELGATREDFLEQLGTTESALKGQITTGLAEVTTKFGEQIGGLKTDLVSRIQAFENAGLSRDQATRASLAELADELGETEEGLLSRLGTTESQLKSEISGVETRLGEKISGVGEDYQARLATAVGNITNRINEFEAYGATRDEALSAAIDSVADELGLTKDNLLAELGETESTLGARITESEQAFAKQLGTLQTDLVDRIGAFERAGLTRDDAIKQSITELADELGDTEEGLLQKLGTTEQQLKTEIGGVEERLGAQIGTLGTEYEAKLSTAVKDITAQMNEFEAYGATRDEALQAAIDNVASELGLAREDFLSVLGETESSLGSRISASEQAFAQQLGSLQTDLVDRIGAFERAGLSRDDAIKQSITELADELGDTEEGLLQKLGTTEQQLQTQIGGVEERLGAQIGTLGREYETKLSTAVSDITDQMNEFEAYGATRDEALQAAIDNVAEQLGLTSQDLLDQLELNQQQLQKQIEASELEYAKQVTGLGEQVTGLGTEVLGVKTGLETLGQKVGQQVSGLGSQVSGLGTQVTGIEQALAKQPELWANLIAGLQKGFGTQIGGLQSQLTAQQKAQQAQAAQQQAAMMSPKFEAFYANIPGYKPFDVRQFSSDFYDEE